MRYMALNALVSAQLWIEVVKLLNYQVKLLIHDRGSRDLWMEGVG